MLHFHMHYNRNRAERMGDEVDAFVRLYIEQGSGSTGAGVTGAGVTGAGVGETNPDPQIAPGVITLLGLVEVTVSTLSTNSLCRPKSSN